MLDVWCYIGKTNKFFTCGELYQLRIEADKRNEELVFNIHSTDHNGFVISKEYIGFESIFENWCPVAAMSQGISCKEFEDSIKYQYSYKL